MSKGKSPPSPPSGTNNARAIMWMVVSVICFSAMSLCVKHAANQGIAPFQIVFARVLFGLVAILPFALIAGPRSVLATKRPFRHMLRSAVGVSAMVLLFIAFSRLNMTETVALNFTVPFFVALGAAIFLGEVIRMRRIAATVVGFLGVLVVAQPWNQASKKNPRATSRTTGLLSKFPFTPKFALNKLYFKVAS